MVGRIEYEHILISHLWEGVFWVDDWFEKLSMNVLFATSLGCQGRIFLWMIRDLPNGSIWTAVLTRVQRVVRHNHADRPSALSRIRMEAFRCWLISQAFTNGWRIGLQFFVKACVYFMHCWFLLFGWSCIVRGFSLLWLLHLALLRLWWVFSRPHGSLFTVIKLGWCSCPCTRLQFAKLNHAILIGSLSINRG